MPRRLPQPPNELLELTALPSSFLHSASLQQKSRRLNGAAQHGVKRTLLKAHRPVGWEISLIPVRHHLNNVASPPNLLYASKPQQRSHNKVDADAAEASNAYTFEGNWGV